MLATTSNPATIPLPPSQVDSLIIVGSHSLGGVESPISTTLVGTSVEPSEQNTRLTPGAYPQGIGKAGDFREKMDDNFECTKPPGMVLSPLLLVKQQTLGQRQERFLLERQPALPFENIGQCKLGVLIHRALLGL
ncbi:hypothetical protein BDZ91DRAFT_247630 [Kalaharituber pfeilii]|nr:hypothetical protein BDZ91DRAFT_247630 [Kalaharituber pfeilii]